MRLLVLCTCHEVVSNLPQGCVPQNYAILLFAYLLSLPYLVALHCTLNLNSGIVTLIRPISVPILPLHDPHVNKLSSGNICQAR